ncbi:hypothetical protein AXF23_00010 [Prevotella sp. oral taxon 313]|nr:hypothetical protein AXF23_00010 [Prevotella sp. oral taxon 313]
MRPVYWIKNLSVQMRVWMVEKKDGSTHMYSLNDFKIHNTINIANGYMEGRYGAIPFIGDLKM